MILQITGRSARAPELVRLAEGTATIGRAFGNDVIVADPFVAPAQIEIEIRDGACRLRVLDETNPVLLNGEPLGTGITDVASGDRVTIGRTELRLYAPDHPVEQTRKLLLTSWMIPGRVSAFAALALWLGVCAIDAAMDYLQVSVDLEWDKYAYAGLFAAVFVLLWTGTWAIVGRVLRHQPHFFVQLLATTFVYAALIVVVPAAAYLEFATNSVLVGEIAYYAIGFGSLAALLRVNLFFATNIRNATRVALFVAAALVGLTFAAVEFGEDEWSIAPRYSKVVKPPFAKIGGDVAIETFIERADRLQIP